MVPHPDQRYIEGLLRDDSPLIEEIYRRFSPTILRHIAKNGGSEADAADIFQESLIDIYHQAKHKSLQLTCPFEPFLLLVARRKWLNRIKKKGRGPVTKSPDELYPVGEDVFREAELLVAREDRVRHILQQFGRLGEKCREIIRRSLQGEKGEELAAALGVTHGYLRKKKSECMGTLLAYVQEQKM
jgi:RNA polymerase sigma factor (sigma-70 family)